MLIVQWPNLSLPPSLPLSPSTLAFHLHSLPPLVVAEMLVPLMLTPLVMAEPMAGEQLWKHLLTPVSRAKPRPKMFDSSQTCPLLDAEHYMLVSGLLLPSWEGESLGMRPSWEGESLGMRPSWEGESLGMRPSWEGEGLGIRPSWEEESLGIEFIFCPYALVEGVVHSKLWT